MSSAPPYPAPNRSPFLESRFGALIAHARGLLIGALVIAPLFAIAATGFVAGVGHNPRVAATAGAAWVLLIVVPLFIVCALPSELDDARFRRARIYVNVGVVAFLVLTVVTVGLGVNLAWESFDAGNFVVVPSPDLQQPPPDLPRAPAN